MTTGTKATSAGQHPLNRKWTLWYDGQTTYNANNWELSLVPIMTVSTVEEFFVMLKFIKPLNILRMGSQYHFFQEGIKPMWEDSANKNGGKLWMNLDLKAVSNNSNSNNTNNERAARNGGSERDEPVTEADRIWEAVLMAVVGECLEDPESTSSHITGVVMSKRKYNNRVALWVKDATDTPANDGIKEKLAKEAGIPPSQPIVFSKHGEKN